MERYDIAIIGTGPAGLEAAVNIAIRKKKFILFGSRQLSHKLNSAPHIDNYLGLPAISGKALQAHFHKHLEHLHIPITPQQVQMIYPMDGYFSLAAGENAYEATAVILATGTYHAKVLPGEEALLGRGVGYCATCDAPLYRGRTVAILGYTNEAAHEADYVAEIAAKVYYVPMAKTDVMPGSPVEIVRDKAVGIQGDGKVSGLILSTGTLDVDGVFILRESVAPATLLPGLEVQDEYIKVNHRMETNLPGCYAAGDCTGKPHQFMRAAGEGQTAGLNAVSYIDRLHKAQKGSNG